MEVIDWDKYPNFSAKEFACQHCGKEGINEDLISVLQGIRHEVGFPFIITSGFRCDEHPLEKKKSRPGAHAQGLAADIGCLGKNAHKLLQSALGRNMPGIGVNQKGDARFIHLDILEPQKGRPRPHVWSY